MSENPTIEHDDKKPPVLTDQEKRDGWHIATCEGNGYKPGCRKPYKRLAWHTPSGCPNCHATFVD